ncbi:Phage tail sheath C-terminal domain containing protein [uncultured Caudovirales phage]|uniref:Phage tail sheath C-terminal domain containing protein n=1 Tax=uncultured Caudovirales phage TaxID=2100421 RepID=A0A6J5T3Y9_9CAUD|nr:Phage tail sheath C-terminal domain containing protein [uncultured Caudovirales phage]
MALVSPGLEISIIDESAYLPTGVGTIPFVVFATAENKTLSGKIAPGTLKSNAGKLYGISSQRELANTFGYPIFRRSTADTALHGHELNEYGVMAAYSAMGLGNRVWAMRADIDLNSLVGTSIRPQGESADGTVWLDTSTSNFGIWEYVADNDTFEVKTPILITSSTQTVSASIVPKPSIGTIGSYAVDVFSNNNYIFYKGADNTWKQVGSSAWADTVPAVTSTTSTVDIPKGSRVKINYDGNGDEIVFNAHITTMSSLRDFINSEVLTWSGNTSITANLVSGRLALYAKVGTTAGATANDGNSVGVITIDDSTIANVDATQLVVGVRYKILTPGAQDWTVCGASDSAASTEFVATNVGTDDEAIAQPLVLNNLSSIGIDSHTYGRATIEYATFAQVPEWTVFDPIARPSKSVWIKTSQQGNGANFTIKKYSSASESWKSVIAPLQPSAYSVLATLDRIGGGVNIAAGTFFVKTDSQNNGLGSFTIYTLSKKGATKVTGSTIPGALSFTSGHTFDMIVSVTGSETPSTYSCTLPGASPSDFVASILAAGNDDVSATVEANGAISITHRAGGIISLVNTTGGGNPITTAGFTTSTEGVVSNIVSSTINLTNWRPAVYTFSSTEPSTAPANGTYWYYDDATAVDIMICGSDGWKGYQNVSRDGRGYDLTATDPNGVIVTPSKPTSQSNNSGLAPGDLWLDTGDLENYPKLNRYNGSTWVAIDKTDHTSSNGIIFGDARWDDAGTADTVTGTLPTTKSLLTSNYTDLDAPDYRLYPRGTLLFNTRRGGYIVKKFVQDYFNTNSFNVTEGDLPDVTSTWVSQINLNEDGSPMMGHKAQRSVVVAALKAAVDGSNDLREEAYGYNLLTCPGYPELIVNLVSLNNDRANTGFVIGDTPMTLAANLNDITKYDAAQTTADPYLGVYYPSALSTDLSGNEIAVPASHMMLRTFLHSDNLSYQWFAPAGTRRGLVDNVTAIGYLDATSGLFIRAGISTQLRDTLYEKRLNPITQLQGAGIVAYGQKTRAPSVGGGGSAMDRVNVARLVNYLRTVLRGVANSFLFEPNDKIVRDQVKQLVESVLNDLIGKRGLYDYLVVCDTSNNTADRIARNELYVDVAIEPMKDVEFIYIPIRLKNPGSISGLK